MTIGIVSVACFAAIDAGVVWGDDHHVRLETDQLGCKFGQLPDPPACELELDGNVLPVEVTELAQPLPEGVDFRRGSGRAVKQETDPGNSAFPACSRARRAATRPPRR